MLFASAGLSVESKVKTQENVLGANDLCASLPSLSEKTECRQVISNASYMSPEALQICAQKVFQSDQIRCLGAIVNKNYEIAELTNCGGQESGADKLKCLETSGKLKEGGESEGIRAASALCATLSFSNSKAKCRQMLSTITYVSPAAVDSCKTIDFDGIRIECLGIVANKQFKKNELSDCMKEGFESIKLSCLRDAGKAL